MASYADARSNNSCSNDHHSNKESNYSHSSWIIRVDDIDTPRIVNGSTLSILNSLESLGFEWDESVKYQNNNQDDYLYILEQLKQLNLIYPCYCTRKDIKAISPNGIYPGICKTKQNSFLNSNSTFSLRIDISQQQHISFTDLIQGKQNYHLTTLSGDFIVYRSDQIIAYLLAFVADIYIDNITHIIRGNDLLDSTAKQIFLQNKLSYSIPKYAHIPIICNTQGKKLSKSCDASAVKPTILNLIKAAQILGQRLDKHIDSATISEFWKELIRVWDITKVPKTDRILIK